MDNVLDVRVRIALLAAASLTALSLQTEIIAFLCLVVLWIWLCLFGCIRKAVTYTIAYFALWGLLYFIRDIRHLGNLPLLTVYVRRMLLAVMAAAPVMAAPTGKLIASLNRMKLPKSAALSLAVLFRFMPTIAEEYRCIREAQKFRDIGVSPWEILRHPLRTMEYLLIPMLIRTSKVADELSASAEVRGMRLKGECSSFYQIHMQIFDWAILFGGILVMVFLSILDRMVRGEMQ